MSNIAEDVARRKRINRYKKIITYFVFTMMIVPLILCGMLYVKLLKMEEKLDKYIQIFNEYNIEESLQNNKNNQESTTEEGTNKDNTTTEGSTTVEESTNPGSEETSSDNTTDQTGQESTENTENSTTVDTEDQQQNVTPYREWNEEQLEIINRYKDMFKGKKVYLTFDDGPSVYTKEIIEILDYYGVKATFFVNGREDLVSIEGYKAIVNSGNVIGLHTYSHVYEEIYGSVEQFAKDLTRIQDLVYNLTGVRTYLFRFPGGSSTQKIQPGMTIYDFIDYLLDNNFVYYDWNAVNGDGVDASLPIETLVNNVMTYTIRSDHTIVLMHDAKRNRTTVDSLPLLIETLINAGFDICPIDENTPHIQQRVPNNNVDETT